MEPLIPPCFPSLTDWKFDLFALTLSVLFWAFLDGTTSIFFKKLALKQFPNQTETEQSNNTQTTQNSTPHTDQDIRHRHTNNSDSKSDTSKQERNNSTNPPTPVMTNIQRKYQRSLWKALNYSSLFIFGSITLYLSGEGWAFRSDRYFEGWPQPISVVVYIYYMVEIAHYIYATIIIPWEPKQSDRIQMISHHLITLILLSGSYCYLYWRVGLSLLWLTDMSDPFLEVAKLFKYNNRQQAADYFFTLFAIVFIGSRIIVFPFLIGIPSFHGAWDLPLGHILNYFLWGLTFIFFFWAFIILRIAYRLVLGVGASDTRDED